MKHKFKINNNIYINGHIISMKQQLLTCSIRQLIEFMLIILLFILQSISATSSNLNTNHNQTKQFDCQILSASPISYQMYKLENKSDQSPSDYSLNNSINKSNYNNFIQNCIKNTNQHDQIVNSDFKDYFFSHQTTLVSSVLASNETEFMHIHIFDFRVIKHDIVYIDFKNSKNLPDCSSSSSNNSSNNLVLYFATQQFTTFRLLNLPHEDSSKCLSKLTILLNGKSHLNIIEKKNSKNSIPIEVIHAPLYFHIERVDQESIELNTRNDWLEYLKKLYPMDETKFIEHLFVFCHISHIEIDLLLMLTQTQLNNYVNYHTQLKLINELEPVNLIRRCSSSSVSQSVIESPLNGRSRQTRMENVYLIEFETSREEEQIDENKQIYIFIRECTKNDMFTLVIYSKWSNRYIVIDDYNCNIKFYSNIKILNLIGNEQKNVDTYTLDSNYNDNDNDYQQEQQEQFNSIYVLSKQIESKTKLKLETFNYLKINTNPQHIELSFISKANIYSASDRLSNHLIQQTFVDKNFYFISSSNENNNKSESSDLKHENCSIKFVVHGSLLIDFFNQANSSLINYMLNCTTNDCYFYITNENCKVIQLNSDLTQIEKGRSFLIFNSNLYYNESNYDNTNKCYYFDKYTNNYFMTNNIHPYYSLDKAKDVPSNDYFNSLIDYTRDNRYIVNSSLIWEKYSIDISLDTLTNNFINSSSSLPSSSSTQLSNKHRLSYSFELNTQIKLISLDYSITWSLDSCWLSDNPCATNISKDVIDLKNFYEYYYDDPNYDVDNYEDYEMKSNEHDDIDAAASSGVTPLRRARNLIESNTKLTYSSRTHFKFNSQLKHYETHLNISLFGYNMKNLQNRKYFFCYLKPCSVCECMGDKLETKCDSNSRVSKYFLNKIDTAKLKTIIVSRFNTLNTEKASTTTTTTSWNSSFEVDFNLDSDQIKHDYNCTSLNFPSKLNKETIKVESFSQVTSTSIPSVTNRVKISINTNSTNSSLDSLTGNWIDHNKLTTILILLIMIIIIVMVCVALRTFLPKNFFHPILSDYRKDEENNPNDLIMDTLNNHNNNNNNHNMTNGYTGIANHNENNLISPILTNKTQSEQQMKLLNNHNHNEYVNTNINNINYTNNLISNINNNFNSGHLNTIT